MDDAVLLLANHAEGGGGALVHALGLGWSLCTTPTPPIALVVLVKVPWDQTNRQHKLDIRLVDADGHRVMLGTGPQGEPTGFQINATFEVGRPPGIPAGTPIDFSQAFNLGAGLPLPAGQTFEWRLEIDGSACATRSFRVTSPQQSQRQ